MTGCKRKSPGAGATARRAGIVASEKPTHVNSARRQNRQYAFRGRPTVHAVGPAGPFVATGQVAKALSALVAAGARGVTALEVNSWAYRLGAYVHSLRHDCGLAIETVREPHEGGWHGRYVLRTPIKLEPAK